MLIAASISESSAPGGISRERPNCAYEKREEADAGIRLMRLYFHCLIWHQRGPGSHFASPGCAGCREECAQWLERPGQLP